MHSAPQHSPRPLPLFLRILQDQCGHDPARMGRALEGLAVYQTLKRGKVRPKRRVRGRRRKARLYGAAKDGSERGKPLVILVPSLINPPYILDLDAERSLFEALAARGFDPLLLDWGKTGPAERDRDLDSHVTDILVPLIARQDRPVHLVGYCLGGTMALAAACLTRVESLALIAAPWDFGGYSSERIGEIERLWQAGRADCERMGLVPMELLQAGFWSLAPDKLVAKFARLKDMAKAGDTRGLRAFAHVEDWANNGEPLSFAAGRQLIERLYLGNESGAGNWSIGGTAIDPENLDIPAIEIVSTTDAIVPASARAGLADAHETPAGHVGMIVGSGRDSACHVPLAEWIEKAARGAA